MLVTLYKTVVWFLVDLGFFVGGLKASMFKVHLNSKEDWVEVLLKQLAKVAIIANRNVAPCDYWDVWGFRPADRVCAQFSFSIHICRTSTRWPLRQLAHMHKRSIISSCPTRFPLQVHLGVSLLRVLCLPAYLPLLFVFSLRHVNIQVGREWQRLLLPHRRPRRRALHSINYTRADRHLTESRLETLLDFECWHNIFIRTVLYRISVQTQMYISVAAIPNRLQWHRGSVSTVDSRFKSYSTNTAPSVSATAYA